MAVETRLSSIDQRLSKIEADLLLLKWMTGVNIAALIAILIRLFVH